VKYNEIQALVNNYTGAVRCFDRFADVGSELNSICKALSFGTHGGFNYKVSSTDVDDRGHDKGEIIDKATFARSLQKKCWKIVFSKFDLEKYLTKGVMAKVNDFVESRLNYPFTMKNIFRMVETIVGTSGENMERAIVEAVDNFTRHTSENIFHVEGWKTNAGHMLNRKFIVGYICETQYSFERNGYLRIDTWRGNFERITDLTKALCFLTGKDFNSMESVKSASLSDEQKECLKVYRAECEKENYKFNALSVPDKLNSSMNQFEPNKWYEWGFFRFKVFRKGTGHFEFLNIEDWARLNQAYGKAKGNPLPQEVWKGFKKRTKSKHAA
jgi:flavin-binding protein dodecin